MGGCSELNSTTVEILSHLDQGRCPVDTAWGCTKLYQGGVPTSI